MERREKLGKLWVGPRGAGDDRDERRGALEARHDIGGEDPQLLVLVGGRGDGARPLLLGHRHGLVPADRTADELTQQGTLAAEVGVDGLRRDVRLRGDAAMLVPW